MIERHIPSSGESLPVVGLGTWQSFDIDPRALHESDELVKVVSQLRLAGGSVIDTSPMYGHAEAVVGTVVERSEGARDVFLATKVWTRGEEPGKRQMRESMRLLKRDFIDLIQVHNLLDWRIQLRTLRRWKDEGLVRYVGITHYTASAYADLEHVIASETIDFVQFAYSPCYRAAERSLLARAADRGVAVLVNRPFEEGSALRKIRAKPLPESVSAYASSWSEAMLKWIIAHPAVTCVIPATRNPAHVKENLAAGEGRLPDERERKELVNLLA